MKEFISKVKRIPWWGILAGFGFFALQRGMYRLEDFVSRVTGTIDHAFACKIAAIDDLIPVVPVFIVIYVYSFIFWICGPMAVSLTKKRNFINFCIYMLLAYFIGFLFFAFVPTYMDRVAEGLMKVGENKDIFSKLLFMIYHKQQLFQSGEKSAFHIQPRFPDNFLHFSNMPKRSLFPFFCQHMQPFFQHVCCVGMHFFLGSATLVIFQRGSIRICLSFIIFAGGNSVTKHFL
jgi:hypothetical protein